MASVSFVLRASRPDHLGEALEGFRQVCPDYRELVAGMAPRLTPAARRRVERTPRARMLPGTDDVQHSGRLLYHLLSQATGEWIANMDDDDLWVDFPDLDTLEEDVGFVYGGSLYLDLDPQSKRHGAAKFVTARPIRHPREANRAAGSCWIVRREAWRQIEDAIDPTYWYSDFRIVYHLLERGWRVHPVPEILGVVRRFQTAYPQGEEWKWENYVRKLEESQLSQQ